jgi:hypothetical protein
VELCNQRARRNRRGITSGASTHGNAFTNNSKDGTANRDTSLVLFEPAPNPAYLARSKPHLTGPTNAGMLHPSGGVPSAALPDFKRLSQAPPPASRFALFGPPMVKPTAAPPATSAVNAANALIAAPSSVYQRRSLQPSAIAAGWKLPKKNPPPPADITSTWVPSRARLLARRRAARVRFKPSAHEPASPEVVVQSGSKRSRVLSPDEETATHYRSAARRRIDTSIAIAKRSLYSSDQPEILAREILAAADAIAERKIAAQKQETMHGLHNALMNSQPDAPNLLLKHFDTPGGASVTDKGRIQQGEQNPMGWTFKFPDSYAPTLTPSAALIADEARREKARRAREREAGPSSVSPPTKRHAPGGSPLEPPSLTGPAMDSVTPMMLGASTSPAEVGRSSGVTGITGPPTDLDSNLLFPSAQPVSELVGGPLNAHPGQAGGRATGPGALLDMIERKRQELLTGYAPAMTMSQVCCAQAFRELHCSVTYEEPLQAV